MTRADDERIQQGECRCLEPRDRSRGRRPSRQRRRPTTVAREHRSHRHSGMTPPCPRGRRTLDACIESRPNRDARARARRACTPTRCTPVARATARAADSLQACCVRCGFRGPCPRGMTRTRVDQCAPTLRIRQSRNRWSARFAVPPRTAFSLRAGDVRRIGNVRHADRSSGTAPCGCTSARGRTCSVIPYACFTSRLKGPLLRGSKSNRTSTTSAPTSRHREQWCTWT